MDRERVGGVDGGGGGEGMEDGLAVEREGAQQIEDLAGVCERG